MGGEGASIEQFLGGNAASGAGLEVAECQRGRERSRAHG
jgi:hypothetical protein